MKRCPECLFIYPDSDARCDFDNTALVVVDEAELEATTGQASPSTKPSKASKKRQHKSKGASKKRRSKPVAVITAAILLSGVFALIVYYAVTQRAQHNAQRTQNNAATQTTASVTTQSIEAPATVSSSPIESTSPAESTSPSQSRPPSVIVSTSPYASPLAIRKSASERVVTSHSRTSVAPVSTSGPGMGKKPGGKPTILLTSGGKIDADEVWRTRDGIWYRRAGIVTLLKPSRVKAIVNH